MPMPEQSSHPVVNQPTADQSLGQVKYCSQCRTQPLVDLTSVFLPETEPVVCTGCLEHFISTRAAQISYDTRTLCIDADFTRPHESETQAQTQRRQADTYDVDLVVAPPVSQEAGRPYHGSLSAPPTYSNKPTSLTIQCDNFTPTTTSSYHSYVSTPLLPATHSRRQASRFSHPDPLTDITRLRVRSQGHHCLYPGATFQGTQKSGRNSYDVNVTIVDVDFSTSFLCGYLRIRGLTDDWPELTTYFDAEIIGSRHGFLTQNWGANENEDMVHWSRFPAFKHVKHELKKPHLTMADRDRGAVFMRWKERFLVPDHRVQDINGASFAGFYYVCVDFNPPTPSAARSTTQQMPLTPENDDIDASIAHPATPSKPETQGVPRGRRNSNVRRTGRLPSVTPRMSAPVAKMTGFYFHQNSEPYQQLSLSHVPERASSSFEFR